jgi:phage recombination protein Bet
MKGLTEVASGVIEYSKKMIQTLKNSLYPGAKDESIEMVIDYCKHAKLDVMLKPVHIVPMWIVDKETGKGEMRDVIMPGINLYRIQAARSGCAGISEPEFGEEVTECLGGLDITYPKWCRITVKRIIAGQVVEFSAKEYWKENYANQGKDKATQKIKEAPNAMWAKRPFGQLAKCAEAQALRKAFPEIGSMPTAEEMEGKHLDSQELDALEKQKFLPGKGVSGLKERLNIVTKDDDVVDAEVVEPDFDEVTGEIKEEENHDDTISTIEFLMDSATSKKELMDAMKMAKDLSPENKKKVSALFNKRQSEIKG